MVTRFIKLAVPELVLVHGYLSSVALLVKAKLREINFKILFIAVFQSEKVD